MKTVVLKAFNAIEALAETQIVTRDGKPTIIKAEDGVNYELFDKSIDKAPNHIVNRRVDNDLHVSLERDGKEVDLIIEDFYDNEEKALIGLAEDNNYYYYVPDTGEVTDYVTMLEVGAAEGHALGGANLAGPLWVALPPIVAVGATPWWLFGLAVIPFFFNKKKDREEEDEPTIDVSPSEAFEGENLVHTVKLPKANDEDTVYTFELKGNTATAGDDFVDTDIKFSEGVVLNNDGTITVPAGVTDFTVSYLAIDDGKKENSETTTVSVGGETGIGTINDNDKGSAPEPKGDKLNQNNVFITGEKKVIGLSCCIQDVDGDIDFKTTKLLDANGGEVEQLVVAGQGTWTVEYVGEKANIIFDPEAGFAGSTSPVKFIVTDEAGNTSDPIEIKEMTSIDSLNDTKEYVVNEDFDLGQGYDVLTFKNTSGDINLAVDKVKNVEALNLKDSVDQTLELSASDILDITSTQNTLFIDGDATDTVKLQGLTKADTSDKGGYDLYTGTNDVNLYVNTEITNVNVVI